MRQRCALALFRDQLCRRSVVGVEAQKSLTVSGETSRGTDQGSQRTEWTEFFFFGEMSVMRTCSLITCRARGVRISHCE